jgi:hypothetical protein
VWGVCPSGTASFKTFLDVVHVKRTNVARMGFDPSTRGGEGRLPGVGIGGEDDEDEALSRPNGMDVDEDVESNQVPFSAGAEMEQKLLELSRNPEIYDLLSRSMAPSIYEMDDVKKGILLQLFGGTNKSISRGGGGGGPIEVPGSPTMRMLMSPRYLGPPPPPPREIDLLVPVHIRQRILGCRSHGLCDPRSGFQATCFGIRCLGPLGWRCLLHR